jgi:hypothetical protein
MVAGLGHGDAHSAVAAILGGLGFGVIVLVGLWSHSTGPETQSQRIDREDRERQKTNDARERMIRRLSDELKSDRHVARHGRPGTARVSRCYPILSLRATAALLGGISGRSWVANGAAAQTRIANLDLIIRNTIAHQHPNAGRARSLASNLSGYRRSPVTTMSICRLPHFEHTSRSRRSSTGV